MNVPFVFAHNSQTRLHQRRFVNNKINFSKFIYTNFKKSILLSFVKINSGTFLAQNMKVFFNLI